MENIVSSFLAIVNKMPDYPAVIYEGKSYTYQQLDRQSDILANFLVNRQMKGKQIGAAMERGQEWIIAMLGIWKAGAVYVPLDLNHPAERLETIIADCNIALVICNRSHGFKPDNTPYHTVGEILISEECTQPLPLPGSNDTAYMMYTSGTSGEPKGIPACHRQAVRMSRIAKDQFFYVNSGDRMLQMAGLNFSVSLIETLAALLNGICMVIANDSERHDPRLLIDLLVRERVCSALIPPALLAVFPKVSLETLKTLLVGGEGVAADVKEFWMKGRRMVNAYGFTENTILVASGIYTEETPANDIGTVVPDTLAYVLDEELNPVPDGTPGELCIAGTQLTEGYLNRPELNAVKFVPNPFWDESEGKPEGYSRIYRSGDKVIRLANGHLLYLGRLDNQLKIRGMRIELSEIEQCLNRYPGVSMSIVLLKEHAGRKVLVAYLQADKEISREKITAFVRKKLPDYMRPTYYVTLLSFPMTINRKIDRAGLPDPDWSSRECKEQPATPTEREIAGIWQEHLGVSMVGRYDNFISLGGDSISVLVMTNALEECFGIRLKGEDVFSRLDLHILAQFVEQSVAEKPGTTGKVIHSNKNTSCSLPPALRNLWGQCISSPEMNEAYKLAVFLPWGNELKVELLQRAWNRIVLEQEAMRMSFPLEADGEPRIYIKPFVYADLPAYEVTEEEFLQKTHELYLQPFHLADGPLHRACLYRLPDGGYKLAIVIHHLVTDGWSIRILNEKLHAYYQCAAKEIHFPVENFSYRDYAAWSKDQRDSMTLEQRKVFWKQYMSGCSPLVFEGKESLKILPKEQGRAKYIPMDSSLFAPLETYCSEHKVTPLVACLSIYQLLLTKYTGQTNFAVGLAVTDRKRIEFQSLLGYFVSLLPVRSTIAPNESFEQYSEGLMKTMIDLLSNPLPFNSILNCMEKSETSQLVRFAFGLEESPVGSNVPEEWTTSSPFDMALIIHRQGGQCSFHFQYATSYFDEGFIIQFCESFQTVLRYLLSEPSRTMSTCPLLSEDEISKRISSFTFSGMEFPQWNIIERFRQIAIRQPEHEAYQWSDFRMTYGELDKMSDRLAVAIRQKLLDMNIEEKATPVGVFLKDKQYLLPAILGVLKAGGCYLPLDATLPIERLLFIMEDVGLPLLLTDESYTLTLPCEVLSITHLPVMETSVVSHTAAPSPDDTAYIIYTSGSTGRPKGTPVSHRSLALFAQSQADIYRLSPDKHVLQYASVGFDASIMEIFPALVTGASLTIPTEKERKDYHLLLDLIEKEKVYCALIPPALLSVLPYRALPDFQTLLVGGESTPSDVMERWMQGRRFINAYGPTENTVVTSCHELSDDFLSNDIGTPLPGVSCYVLDNNMTLLPDYVPGELYIGGLQLTAGYINRSSLNREKFVENPFVAPQDKAAGINTKLYKSGDKVMRAPNGHFIFLGRMDSQVKLRGFRIELDEITKQLEEYPAILQAVVLLKECKKEKQIAAYLLTDQAENIDLREVRNFLHQRLPVYMIPSAWVIMDSFPLTINGKVDRKALPEPELLVTEDYEPPITEEEKALSEIAAHLLQLPRIGVSTDLLAMGLTSLQIMELVRDAQEKHISLSVTDVYKRKTIRNILSGNRSSLSFWANDPDSTKPLVVLVCGYPPFKPFYDHLVECFKKHYSFFVFESFLDYYRNGEQPDAVELVKHYHQVIKDELAGRTIDAVMGHCLGGELAMMLAERLRTTNHPAIKALIIEAFIRRDKTLLIPPPAGNELLAGQSNITNAIIKTLSEPVFGGEMIVCLANKLSDRFMFETDEEHTDELLRKMWAATLKNRDDWNSLYPQTMCYRLEADHWNILENESLSTIYEIVKRNWNIN